MCMCEVYWFTSTEHLPNCKVPMNIYASYNKASKSSYLAKFRQHISYYFDELL